jgi:SPP1 family predicted phage head-tail adaptor
MRAGKKRTTITIQSQSSDSDSFGDEIEVYEVVFKAKCDFRVISGAELLKAGLAMNEEVVTILMKYDSRLQYDHSIVHKGNVYNVGSIKPDERYMDMIVTASRQAV